jgi:lysophospholipase L1-like esterase
VTVAARASELYFEGRFDDSAAAGPRFALPGSAVWLRFTGTGAKMTLGEHSLETDEYGQIAHNWYDVTVDGQPSLSFRAAEGVGTYTVATALSAGEHQIVIRKRTEAYVGDGQFLGFELDGGATLLQVNAPSRRIEFIGDSITAAFGVEGADSNCLFSAETENYSRSYAALTAQALQAEQITVAASGAGAYRNWGGSTHNTMGVLYERTIPTDFSSRWSFSRWTPDVVVLNLGTGDFTSGDPGRDAFMPAYRKLLARVRQNYPSALLVVAVGPMLSDLWPAGARALTQGRSYVSDLVVAANQAGDANVKYIEFPNQDQSSSFGCKAHPSVATQKQVADQLTAFLRQQMGW